MRSRVPTFADFPLPSIINFPTSAVPCSRKTTNESPKGTTKRQTFIIARPDSRRENTIP